MVNAQAVALRVAVREEPSLQHLVGREADAGHDVGGVERRLLDLGEVVFGVAVQLHHAHLDQRVVLVRPHLGEVERMVRHLLGVQLRHHLDAERPAREVALFDVPVEVALMALAALADDRLGLFVSQVLDALLGLEVELHPKALVLGVDHAEGVTAVSVHGPVGGRDAAVAHHDRHLMQRLGQQGPEIPVVERAAQVGARVAFDHMVQVRELERVAQEEDRRVVAHQIPVALVGVELDRKAANVALSVRRTALARHGRKAHKEVGLLAHLGKDRRARVGRDVVRHRKGAVRARAFGVHAPLRNHLAVEVREFFEEPRVL